MPLQLNMILSLRINRTFSNEFQNILTMICQKSSSQIVSIRAMYCLIFINHSNVNSTILSSWFERQTNLTIELRYEIFIQQLEFICCL